MDSLRGKVAIVTGGGRGIGRATARGLAREGAMVAICARTESEIQDTASQIRSDGGETIYRVCDVGRPDQARRFVSEVKEQFGRLDILINNASILGPKTSLLDYPLDRWNEVIRTNLTGPLVLTQAVLPSMMNAKSGEIINITSSVGRMGRGGWGAYSVSKFGVEALTQILSDELQDTGIRIIALNPEGTRTHMRAEAYPHEDPSRLKSPEVVADSIVRLLKSNDGSLSGKSLDAGKIMSHKERL